MDAKVYRDPQRTRILFGGIVVAMLVLGIIIWGTLSLDRQNRSSGSFTGKVIAKEFTPEPAREITVGRGGLKSTRIEGEYLLKVETPNASRVYNVWVDRSVYLEYEVGSSYYVIPTP